MDVSAFWRVIRSSYRSFAASGTVLILLFSGLLVLGCLAPQKAQGWKRVQELSHVDARTYQAAHPQSAVLVTGMLEGNPTHTPGGLVAYVEQGRDGADGGIDGSPGPLTSATEGFWPPLTIVVGSGRLRTAQVNSLRWGGDLHLERAPLDSVPGPGRLSGGPAQRLGLKNGDQVTVGGLKGLDGKVVPERIYRGDRAALLQELSRDVWLAYLSGVGFILVALAVAFWAVKGRAVRRGPNGA
jgi:hypothetical protein